MEYAKKIKDVVSETEMINKIDMKENGISKTEANGISKEKGNRIRKQKEME